MKGRWARFVLALGEALGSAAWALGLRKRVALDGLRRAFPDRTEQERRATGRAAYRQLGRSLAEVALAPGVRDPELADLVRFDNWDLYESARALGRGVVVAVAHFGNWELLARACARRGVPLTAITRVLRGRLNRQPQCERTSLALRALDGDSAPVQLGEPPGQRQPEPGTLLLSIGPLVQLLELLKDQREVGLAETDSCVNHRNFDRLFDPAPRDRHSAARWRELDAVGDEVQKHLFELPRIGHHIQVGIGCPLNGDLLLRCQRLDGTQDHVYGRCHRRSLEVQLHLPCFHLRQVEYVVDETKQMLAACIDLL